MKPNEKGGVGNKRKQIITLDTFSSVDPTSLYLIIIILYLLLVLILNFLLCLNLNFIQSSSVVSKSHDLILCHNPQTTIT